MYGDVRTIENLAGMLADIAGRAWNAETADEYAEVARMLADAARSMTSEADNWDHDAGEQQRIEDEAERETQCRECGMALDSLTLDGGGDTCAACAGEEETNECSTW